MNRPKRFLCFSLPAFFLDNFGAISRKFFFSEKMKIRNFQIENKLSKVKIKEKIQMPQFRQLSFGTLNSLAYILVVLTLIGIIIAFRVSMLFEKMEH